MIQERPDYILACKLKLLKNKLKEWNASNGGNLKKKISLLNQTSSMDLVHKDHSMNMNCWEKLDYTWNFKGFMKRKYETAAL